MRRSAYIVLAIVVLFLLSACNASQSQEQLSESASATEPVVQTDIENETAPSNDSEAESMEQSSQEESESEMTGDMEEQPEEKADAEAMATETMDIESMASEMMATDRPVWQQIALTNARTGETFTLADFEGQTVFVEPMATWCSNCRRQLGNVRDAKQQLAGEDVVFVALSVETNIDDATLASYANGEGFDWLFAVVTPEMLGHLADEFGRSIANPPATPHFIIRADGSNTDLVTGIEPSDQIVAQIIAAQS